MNKYIPIGACAGILLFSVPSFASIQQECQNSKLHSEVVCKEAMPIIRAELGQYAPPSFDPTTLQSYSTQLGQFKFKDPNAPNNGPSLLQQNNPLLYGN